MSDVETVRRYYETILPFYDAALADRGDLPFWEAIGGRWSPARILELGCGTGRVTEVLSRCAPVTAVDLLVEMLRHGTGRAGTARPVAADLRRFAFRARFDLIVLADDPMAHLTSMDDRKRVMGLIAEHLTLNGRVVLEGLYRYPGGAESATQRKSSGLTITESWLPTDDPSIWNASYEYKQGSTTVSAAAIVRSWSGDEIARLADSGLSVESVWGDFDQSPFSERSKRVIIVAARRPAA